MQKKKTAPAKDSVENENSLGINPDFGMNFVCFGGVNKTGTTRDGDASELFPARVSGGYIPPPSTKPKSLCEGKENLEQIVLIKKEDDETKPDEDGGNLYYIIKDNNGDLMEGILSGAEIVYYDNGSNSGLSSGDSDGKTAAVGGEEEEEEKEEEGEEEEEEEEEYDMGKEEPEEDADEKNVVVAGVVEDDGDFESKTNRSRDKLYKILIKSKKEFALKEAQAKALVKSRECVQKLPCPYCSKMLTRVDEHIRLMHRNKVYICNKSECGAQFTTLKNLQSHQLTCYDVAKAYKCPYCGKEFHRKSNYKAHVRRHNSKKEFKCQLCESAFVDTTGLRRHFLKHHEPEREVFVSNCCGKRFKSKEGLRKHINRRICGIEVLQVVEPSSIEVPV